MTLGPQDVHRSQAQGGTIITLCDRTYPLVRFTVALRYGALADPAEARGTLAMLMPLLLRGTKNKSRKAFNQALEGLGSGVDAVVGHDVAYLTGTCLSAHLEQTLALVGEALAAPALLEDELAKLCDEGMQGLMAERDDDDSVADLFMRRALYGSHALGTAASGTLATLARINVATVRSAWEKIAAQQLIVALVGDVTPQSGHDHAAKLLDMLPKRGQAAPQIQAPQWPQKPSLWVIDKPDRTQVQLRVAVGGVGPTHPDLDAFWLGIVAFGGTFTSPLTREVRDVRGWSYFAHADFRRRSVLPSPVTLRSAPSIDDAIDCLALKLDLLTQLGEGALEPLCVKLARDYLLGRVPFQQATVFDLAGPAVMIELLGLPAEALWDLPQRLANIDTADVPNKLKCHLAHAKPTAVLVAPAAEIVFRLEAKFPGWSIHTLNYADGAQMRQLSA